MERRNAKSGSQCQTLYTEGSSSRARSGFLMRLRDPPQDLSEGKRLSCLKMPVLAFRACSSQTDVPAVSESLLFDNRDKSEDSSVAPPVPMTNGDLLPVCQRHHGREAGCGGRHRHKCRSSWLGTRSADCANSCRLQLRQSSSSLPISGRCPCNRIASSSSPLSSSSSSPSSQGK